MIHSGRHKKSHATAARRHTPKDDHAPFFVLQKHPNRTSTSCKILRWALDYTFKSRWQTASTLKRIFITSPHAAPHVFQHVSSLTRRAFQATPCAIKHRCPTCQIRRVCLTTLRDQGKTNPGRWPPHEGAGLVRVHLNLTNTNHYRFPLGVLVESHLDGGFKLASKVWDSHFEPFVWWWCFIFVGLVVKPPISITKWADAHLRNPSAGKTRWSTLVWKNAVENKKMRQNQKIVINDFAKLRHPQPRSLLSLGTMDSGNGF